MPPNQSKSSAEVANPPYRLEYSPELGRYLVATRAFKPGDVVMKDYPLASAPGPLSERVCFACHRLSATIYDCTECRSRLCGIECQSSAEHQKECKYLKKIKPEIVERHKMKKIPSIPLQLSMIIVPLRSLFLRKEQPEKWKLLMDLVQHLEARKRTPVWSYVERNITPFLLTMMADEMPDLTGLMIQQICAAVDVNCFEIRVRSHDSRRLDQPPPQPISTTKEMLRGMYYTAALMAHSCVVNAQISIDFQSQMTVKATVPIQEGESICISYTDPLQTTLQRRDFLHNGKHFICRCRRCQDPTEFGTYASAIRCPSCTSGWVLPHDDPATDVETIDETLELCWKCTKCGKEMHTEEVRKMEEIVQNIVKTFQQLPVSKHLIDRCEELFATLPKKVHPNHTLLVQLRISLIHLYGNLPGFFMPDLTIDQLKRKIQICNELLEALGQLCPGYSRLRGIVLYEVHAPIVCLASKRFERGQASKGQLISDLKEAESRLKESVGILIQEPVSSPESSIAKAAMADLKQLRNYIQDMEKLKRM